MTVSHFYIVLCISSFHKHRTLARNRSRNHQFADRTEFSSVILLHPGAVILPHRLKHLSVCATTPVERHHDEDDGRSLHKGIMPDESGTVSVIGNAVLVAPSRASMNPCSSCPGGAPHLRSSSPSQHTFLQLLQLLVPSRA